MQHDYEDFDLDRSIAEAWVLFSERLADVVASMDTSSDLRIDIQESDGQRPAGNPFVRFRALGGGDEILLEAASNGVLSEANQLGPEALALMEESGFEPPTTEGEHPTGCFWAVGSQEQSERLAQLAVIALHDIYGVQHPVFLVPDQLASILTLREDIDEPATSEFEPEDVIATLPVNRQHLDRMIAEELSQLFGHEPLRDSDGDFAIRVGSTMVFVRSTPDHLEVVVFSVVVHDVEGRSRAVEILNDLNAESRYVRFELIRDRVFLQMSVLAHPFVPAHLHQAVRAVSEVADGVDEELAMRLHGRTTFETEL